MTRHCPLCGLNFRFTSELHDHARADHQPVALGSRDETITRYLKSGRKVPATYRISM